MITKDTYFVKFSDGKSAWLAPDKEIPKDIDDKELRIMLFPTEGKVLKHKTTGEISNGLWLKDTTEDDYIEIIYKNNEDDIENL